MALADRVGVFDPSRMAFVDVGPADPNWPFRSKRNGNASAGIDYTFCRLLREKYPDHDIRLIRAARGGRKVQKWLHAREMAFLLRLYYERAAGILESGGVAPRAADYLLVHQGEGDYDTDGLIWVARWKAAIESMKRPSEMRGHSMRVLPVDDRTKICFGELAQGGPKSDMNRFIGRLSDVGKIAMSSGLRTQDGTHFLPEDLEEMGRRYFQLLEG